MRRRRRRRPACAPRDVTASGASPSMMGTIGCSPGADRSPDRCMLLAKVAGIRMHPLAQLGSKPRATQAPSRCRRRPAAQCCWRTDRAAIAGAASRRFLCAPPHSRRSRRRAPCPSVPVMMSISVHHAAQFVGAAAPRADESGGVRVIDHHQGAVAFGQRRRSRRAWRSSRPSKKRRRSRSSARWRSCESFKACSSSFISLFA